MLSSSSPPIEKTTADNTKEEIKHKQYSLSEITAKWLPIIAGTAIAIFTWKIMCVSEDTMKIANRAYISLRKPTIKNIDVIPNIKFELVFENTGQTPAFNAYSTSSMIFSKFVPSTIIPVPSTSDTLKKRTVIGKNSTTFIDVMFDREPDFAEIDSIRNGDLLIVCFGVFRYDDIFEKSHEVGFCLYFNWKTKNLYYCPKHNYAD